MSHHMPTPRAIKKHWENWLVKQGKFNSIEELWEEDYCFACGMVVKAGQKWTERAHIRARSLGGLDSVQNLHLLCHGCHVSSEMLDGEDYVAWFKKRDGETMLRDSTSLGSLLRFN